MYQSKHRFLRVIHFGVSCIYILLARFPVGNAMLASKLLSTPFRENFEAIGLPPILSHPDVCLNIYTALI